MNGVIGFDSDDYEFVEVDPTGRYGRYNEILGKGASKTVYRAFDEYEGIEVAWNQVKLHDFLKNPDDLERLYCEIHLLKTLKHKNIMKFYTSWVDTTNMKINFVTEMFTSGTLRQYRLKHRRVNIRAIKHWCRQILKGLLYLHSRDPPIIHRDLKCDNIFINGNQGEVKIGDLGLAAILRKSHAACCVGTPEFMAPEVYAEEYNELVDIYAFGMCILEMVTFEYPYSECTHPAQIYKKVMSGRKPDALYKVKDPEVRRFVEKCLASVSNRLSAKELLGDSFLQIDDYVSDLRPLDYCQGIDDIGPVLKLHHSNNSLVNDYPNHLGYEEVNDLDCYPAYCEVDELDLFEGHDDDHFENVDITIKGRKREDDGIFLRLRIADKEGRVRNIYFPFDIQADTALSVATEMVAELDITDQDVIKIADMIDGEIASLVPEWKSGFGIEQSRNDSSDNLCHNCASNSSLVDYITSESPAKNLQVVQCSRQGCGGGAHGRFEEITYQFDGSEQQESNQSDSIRYTDIWAQRDGPELTSQYSSENHLVDKDETSDRSVFENIENFRRINNGKKSTKRGHYRSASAAESYSEDYENEIRRELRWLKTKYQLQLGELRDQQLGAASKSPGLNSDSRDRKVKLLPPSVSRKEMDKLLLQSFGSGKHFTENCTVNAEKELANLKLPKNFEAAYSSCSPGHMITAKNFYPGTLLPHSLHRTTSLPVDASDF